MVLIILAFQGIPLGGSGGPEKDRTFLVCGGDFHARSPRIRLAS